MFKTFTTSVVITASLFGLSGCTQSEAVQNTKACEEFASEVNSLATAFEYVKADVNAQNLTGSYDLDGLNRQLATLRGMATDISRIEGTEKFNAARDEFVRAFGAYISATTKILEGGSDVDALEAEGDIQRSAVALEEVCPVG